MPASPTTPQSSTQSPTHNRIRVDPLSTEADRPLWSVMIPTYNCANYLRQTLSSVLAQDLGAAQMQIEVIDDCSTKDDPEAVVQELAGDRVVFYRQPHNVGHTKNFATCLIRSRGQIVHLLHGDDQVLPGFYTKLQDAFAQNPQLGAAFCRCQLMDEHDQPGYILPSQRSTSGIIPNWLERIAVQQLIQTPSIVVRRQVYEQIGGFDYRLSWSEDWEMWVRIASQYPVWFEPEVLALYRVHSSSNSGRYVRTGEDMRDIRRAIKIMQQYLPADRAKHLSSLALRHYARYGLDQAQRSLTGAQDLAAAIAQLREATIALLASLGFWRNYAPDI
ncbi:glycosyl transferase family 2 [Thalassoporum mexicanum PCC 7367]|uniref:glycosyltransferase family 2 protein n=1 Tax=Thalassoporum mexicanum TaxID=3457544 RepID=UPI00029F8D9A|nr:glycosyltransferase [Pseudanabaena sp. PCC 7367]AFY68804.1 glycosyl transferase family 2 [Pseudanabaena sp. PCC 7367]